MVCDQISGDPMSAIILLQLFVVVPLLAENYPARYKNVKNKFFTFLST